MPFTSHGHKVPGLAEEGKFEGPVARCGGPGLCVKCSQEAANKLREVVFGSKHGSSTGSPGDAARE